MIFQGLNLNGVEYKNGQGFKLISGQQAETARVWPSTQCAWHTTTDGDRTVAGRRQSFHWDLP
jgi:hypothetical protein